MLTENQIRNLGRWAIVIIFIMYLVVTTQSKGPRVIVNMPADAQPLAQLDSIPRTVTEISGNEAILWWTVYKYTADKADYYSATEAATYAVSLCGSDTNKAVLWWSVYKTAADRGYYHSGVSAACKAVRSCYQ